MSLVGGEPQRRRRKQLGVTPHMGSLLLHAGLAVAGALVGAVVLYVLLTWLLDLPLRASRSAVEQQKQLADVVKVALGLAVGVGAAVAIVVGYRRARVEEATSHRDDQRLFASRYQDAAQLFGHEKAAVRLAGVYAMSRLADDWVDQRQQCIDVLCAYIRLPYQPDDAPEGEREVRYTVLRLVSAHLQPDAPISWQGAHLDFTGAVFDGGDFTRVQFSSSQVSFNGAQFVGGTVSFSHAKFSGGEVDFSDADVRGAVSLFSDAKFSGGRVNLGGATGSFPANVRDVSVPLPDSD